MRKSKKPIHKLIAQPLRSPHVIGRLEKEGIATSTLFPKQTKEDSEMDIETQLKHFGNHLANLRRSKLTQTTYKTTSKKFLEFVGKQAQDITSQDLENFVQHLLTVGHTGRGISKEVRENKPYHNNTYTNMYCGLKSFVLYLNEKYHNGITYNEELLKPPRQTLPEKVVLTREEIQSMFRSAEGNKRDEAILKVLFYSTQRRSSIAGLNLSDINWEKETLFIRTATKEKLGKREYEVGIHEAIPTLRDYVDSFRSKEKVKPGHENALFLTSIGNRITGQSIYELVKRIASESGITKLVYPHLFRATACSLMDEGGMTRDQICIRSGHKNIKSLDTYIRVRPEMANKKADSILSLEPQPETPQQPPKKPQPQDVMVGSVDEQIRLLEIQEKLLLLRQQKQHTSETFYS